MTWSPQAQASATRDAVARRLRLRQYQAQLLERMQAARTDRSAPLMQLGLQIGTQRYLIELTQTGEIVTPGAFTPVPLTRAWYLGLSNIRGKLVGVIDLAQYLGQVPTARSAENRVITFSDGLGLNCALLAARVFGLRQQAQMRALPGCRWCDDDDNEWTRLDLAALVREARFLQIGV